MKQRITVIYCLLLLFCVYTSCNKTESIKASDATMVKQQNETIESAKVFFNSNKGIAQAAEKPTSENKRPFSMQQIVKIPLWQDAYIVHTKDKGDAVVVSLKYDKSLHFKTSFGGDKIFSMDEQSKLWIYKDSSGNYKSEVVITLPSKSFLEGKAKFFEGYVLTEDWNGSNLKKQKYFAGKTHKIKSKDRTMPEMSISNIEARSMCNVIFWYLCDVDRHGNYSNCVYQYTQVLDCDDEEQPHDTLEPQENPGGGGPSEDDLNCFNQAVSQFNQEVNGGTTVSIDESVEISDIDAFTKNKNPKWVCFNGLSGWNLISQEVGVIKLISTSPDKWAWVSLVHGGITMSGSSPIGVGITFTQGIGTPSFTPATATSGTVLYGGMSINYSVTYKFICNCPNIPILNMIPDVTNNYTSNKIWNAKPI